MKIWDLSIERPIFILMLTLALVLLGTISFFRMPVDLYPDVSFPIVAVTTVYPGASPGEVEEQVTSVLEEALSTLPGVDTIISRSSEGVSVILVEFSLKTLDERAGQDVREQVNLVRNQLPEDTQDPVVQRFDPASFPILTFAIADHSDQMTPAELRTLAEDVIQPPLERIPGVAAVEVEGGQVREIRVNLDLQAMQSRRIAPQQVAAVLQTENLNIPGGVVKEEGQQFLIRTPGDFRTIEEIENLIINWQGSPIYLRDVARVEDSFVEQETLTRLNDEEAVVVSVRKQSGSNTTAVASQVKKQFEPILQANPNLELKIARDESIFVQRSIDDAIKDLLLGALFAGLVVLVFFRDLRNTVITVIGLPVIMIGTLFFLDILGITLNLVTLLALALSVGLVIDDAIVVRENIFRWMGMGYSPWEAASKATSEVALSVVAMTLTIVCVFLPIAYTGGIVGQFFREFGITVVLAVLLSMVEAFTLAPMLSAYFFKPGQEREGEIDEHRGEETAGAGWLDRIYRALLNWTLDHKPLTTVLAIVVIAVSLSAFSFLDRTLLPDLDQGEIDIDLRLDPGASIEVTEQQAIHVASIINRHPKVADVFTTVGGRGTPERAQFLVKLKGGSDEKSKPVIEELRPLLADIPNISFRSSRGALSSAQMLLGNRDLSIEMISYGGDFGELAAASEYLVSQLKAIPGLVDVEDSHQPGKPEVHLDIDRQRAANFGLSTAQIGATIRTLINGEVVSTYRGAGAEADIRVQLQESDRSRVSDIPDINLLSPTGQLVPLRNMAQITMSSGPTEIQRINRQPTISMGANYAGRNEAEVLSDVKTLLETIQLPPGIEVKLAGQAELMEESFTSLLAALLLSIAFVYMVLASQFSSLVQPILIMLAMPLAVVGAVLALLLVGLPLDMTAMIGFIMLMGLVTKNSIMLVDFANKERKKGANADMAMRRAGPVRLRPILMTAISLILGMLPVALAVGAGGDFRAPMAIAVIGGMTTSTLLTLFIVPLSYSILVDRLEAWQAHLGFRRINIKQKAVVPNK